AGGAGFHGAFHAAGAAPFHAAPAAPLHAAHGALRAHQRFFRRGHRGNSPAVSGDGDFDPYYYYAANAAPYDAAPYSSGPAAASSVPVPSNRVVVYTPGCRTQTQTVSAEGGGTRTVNVTRCY